MGSSFNFGVSALQRLASSVVRWEQQKSEIMQLMRVCLPGQVQAFYSDTQTVDVLITTNENLMFTSGPQISLKTLAQQLPLLSKIPVVVVNGGGINITFPIRKGDECMVLFADTPIGVWMQSGTLNNFPIDQRRHSLSDGVAIFGVRSNPRALDDYSTDSAQFRTDDGETYIDLKSGQITAKATNVIIEGTTKVEGNTQLGTGSDTINLNGSGSSMPNSGWGTPVGGVLIPSFTAPATLIQCSEAIAYIIQTLKALGIFAA